MTLLTLISFQDTYEPMQKLPSVVDISDKIDWSESRDSSENSDNTDILAVCTTIV